MQPVRDRTTIVLELFDRYYHRVYAFLRKSTTADVAEDLSQETFLRVLQHPELERLEISVSYLLKIAHNLLRRRYARASRLRELLEERSRSAPEAEGSGACELADRDLLETALGLVGKDERDAIRLIVCEGLSYQHAADALGVSVATVNNWKHRGLAKLRRILVTGAIEEAAGLEATDARASARDVAGTPPDRAPRAADESLPKRDDLAWRMRVDDAA